MKKEALKILTEIYQKILFIESDLQEFEDKYPGIKKVNNLISEAIEELDLARHQIREEFGILKNIDDKELNK